MQHKIILYNNIILEKHNAVVDKLTGMVVLSEAMRKDS